MTKPSLYAFSGTLPNEGDQEHMNQGHQACRRGVDKLCSLSVTFPQEMIMCRAVQDFSCMDDHQGGGNCCAAALVSRVPSTPKASLPPSVSQHCGVPASLE